MSHVFSTELNNVEHEVCGAWWNLPFLLAWDYFALLLLLLFERRSSEMFSVDSSALLHANIPKHVTFFNFVEMCLFLQVEPGKPGAEVSKKKNYRSKKEFAYRMCTGWPLMSDVRHIWNVIYNARSNRCHPPTSPSIVPATKNDSHHWSSWHMKRHLQCAEQQASPSNLTKYRACHAKLHSKI